MNFLRTPDARFAGLPGWPFAPHYTSVPAGDGTELRVHHVDEGPRDADPIVLLHGEPSWSYLYRKLIPLLTAAGHRVLAPDLIGFGRSDKPTDPHAYSYERHVAWLAAWFRAHDLRRVTLVAHDWGGWLAMRIVAGEPGRFARVVATNTGFPTCDAPPNETAQAWFALAIGAVPFPVGDVIQLGTTSTVAADVIAGYDAPYPDESYKQGPRRFPEIAPKLPTDPGVAENRAAWRALERFERPFLTLFGDGDPLNAGNERLFQERVPGARGQPHAILRGGGHYLQEDVGEDLADAVLRWMSGGVL